MGLEKWIARRCEKQRKEKTLGYNLEVFGWYGACVYTLPIIFMSVLLGLISGYYFPSDAVLTSSTQAEIMLLVIIVGSVAYVWFARKFFVSMKLYIMKMYKKKED